MKKKRYFKDLDTDTKIAIVMNNQELHDIICNDYYEYSMRQQVEEGELMLGKDYKGIDIRDHYSSFYLVLTDWHKFLDNLEKDYLCRDGLDLYDEIIKLKEEYENIDVVENEERFDELEETLEEKCKELLSICEKQLHEYEHYTEEDIKEYLKCELEANDLWENYYVLGNKIGADLTKVYEDIKYTKVFE